MGLEGQELVGFISGIKGKLFEMKYVDYLNSGNLPVGYEAYLADSATQPGWDIAIRGPDNQVTETLSAKATDSVGYVREALEKYPHIDIVTTDEVYSELVLSGVSSNIVSGGLTNSDITEQVLAATDGSSADLNLVPPIATMALIAFTSYREQSLDLYEKSRLAGDRAGRAYLASLLGGGLAVATQTWWLGVIGAAASRYWGDSGKKRAGFVAELERLEVANQRVIDRLKGDRTDGGEPLSGSA